MYRQFPKPPHVKQQSEIQKFLELTFFLSVKENGLSTFTTFTDFLWERTTNTNNTLVAFH